MSAVAVAVRAHGGDEAEHAEGGAADVRARGARVTVDSGNNMYRCAQTSVSDHAVYCG